MANLTLGLVCSMLVTLVVVTWCGISTYAEESKPTITPIDSPTTLYFDGVGQLFVYPTQWKVVTYVNLKPTQMLWRQVKAHQLQIVNYCSKIRNTTWYAMTDCHSFTSYIQSKVRYIDQLKDIVADYLYTQQERKKRGILNFGGDVLKFLFGTLTQADANKYTRHIEQLETEQQSFLRISQEQMIVLKSAITSFNLTMQKVNKNERILTENLQRLNKVVVGEINQMRKQLNSYMILNDNIQQIQRGLDECQHTFEILVDAFLHAQDGVIQPQLITVTKVKDMMKTELLPDGLDFPSFPSLELSRLITPVIFYQNSCLVYILQIPLLQLPVYHLYKILPFPMKQKENLFVYIETAKEFIFVDAIRTKYGKMTFQELQTCFRPNELTYVCKETVPLKTYILNEDCESTLIHPSTSSIPKQLCEQRVLTLETTFWIPLHFSNEWLYVTPKDESFTVLCGSIRYKFSLQNRGKLFLPPRCKGYSAHNTLYALSVIMHNNSQDDVLPMISIDLDCCLTEHEQEQLNEIPLRKPLANILSSVEDLNVASVKIKEIQDLINQEQTRRFDHLTVLSSTWGSIVLTIVLVIILLCCSCCCCKCCRQCVFWIWDKWTPKECIRHTRERCCVITNINADRVTYQELPQILPSTSVSSPSLQIMTQEPQLPQLREATPRRRSLSRLGKSMELTEFQGKTKSKERKGER